MFSVNLQTLEKLRLDAQFLEVEAPWLCQSQDKFPTGRPSWDKFASQHCNCTGPPPLKLIPDRDRPAENACLWKMSFPTFRAQKRPTTLLHSYPVPLKEVLVACSQLADGQGTIEAQAVECCTSGSEGGACNISPFF